MSDVLSPAEKEKSSAAKTAANTIESGMKVGLGTGSTTAWLIKHLALIMRQKGLRIEAAATSVQTANLALRLGIKVKALDEIGCLDLTIDGADEFDNQLNLIKGGGGALLREKIIARASERMIVIADPSKDVNNLGKFPLPVEVIPFGFASSQSLIKKTLGDIGYHDAKLVVREKNGKRFVTDEGNQILDLYLDKISDPLELSQRLNEIPGVVENGLFLNICGTVIIGFEDGTSEIRSLENGKSTMFRG